MLTSLLSCSITAPKLRLGPFRENYPDCDLKQESGHGYAGSCDHKKHGLYHLTSDTPLTPNPSPSPHPHKDPLLCRKTDLGKTQLTRDIQPSPSITHKD